MVERLVFNDTVNQWRIYDTYLSYDQIKDVVDTEDSETVEEEKPASVRWEQLVVEVVMMIVMGLVVWWS